ncbi:putative glycoside hydrolase [Oceanobacillus profundus]|uniref:GTP-binding protein n=1 Tax=Oceanobacillus profundus TaxID=372463 RepID=A0A417YLR4_9BACI|nr:putative glycoside hydrolase [Oceanobacillus profundus]MBR3120692.1 putative glycoside hydrolase [Oceanobacillus sp.]MCM3399219.1 putative glycoside hydrolase [Oceanobacillus profundus]MDO6449251.1 putative glycoside hydrolase [Oceanobacillus profundus]RHW34437.1 GTP-binding protein [Oceanobacillus profundus]
MRKRRRSKIMAFIGILLLSISIPTFVAGEEAVQASLHQERQTNIELMDILQNVKRFTYDSGFHFEYPDAVRGIYVTGNSVGSSNFENLVELVDTTDLNAMVIDIKEDHGHLTFKPEEGSPYEDIATNYISDPEGLMELLEEKQIYPIARVVVFKDSLLAKKRPDLSFTQNGEVWVNNKGEAFVSPFEKEVWEYNVEIAKMAAEMGFQEIQFDYVRFPEGFETKDEELEYTLGDYKDMDLNNIKKRVEAVSDFVAYAREELSNYDVDVSVDIFGYAATIEETPGIGQNFSKISENVDVISSMIYPSHWTSYFGIENPDEEPYKLVSEYAKVENAVLGELETPPVSRPWLQDFEAPWLYSGPTKQYGKAEIEAQIKALYENGIDEFLLWNSGNVYTENVDYMIGK